MKEPHKRRTDSIPEHIRSRLNFIGWSEETKHDKLDEFIVRIFPAFIVACLFLLMALMIIIEVETFADIIYAICLAFTTGFVLLGAYCIRFMDTGIRHSLRNTVIFILVTPLVISTILAFLGIDFSLNEYIIYRLNLFSSAVKSYVGIYIGIYTVFLTILLANIGVVSVIVGYFRTYLHRIFRYIETSGNKKTKKKKIAYMAFQIPDIIDVKEVELFPENCEGGFNKELFINTFISILSLGIMVCSYFFLNPFFLTEISYEEMLMIAFLFSLFLSACVLPWSIVKSIGARIISDAPRPYYLWKGLKKSIYQVFFAVLAVMMVMMLSAYYGMDFSRILLTYVGYIVAMSVIALSTSYLYVNYFYDGFKNGIVRRFYEHKYDNDSPKP